MVSILPELALCLAAGAAAAYFFTSSTSSFFITLTLVTCGLWIVVRIVRYGTKQDAAEWTLAGIFEALFFWWT